MGDGAGGAGRGLGGAAMELADSIRPLATQPAAQEVGEESVVAVGGFGGITHHQKEVAAVHVFQQLGGVGPAGDAAAEVGRQLVEDRGFQEEVAHGRFLLLPDLFHQIIEDVAVAAGEGLDETIALGRCELFQGEGEEAHAGDPAFGALLEAAQVGFR